MLRVLSIMGTRPEAIKMAPVIEQLRKHPSQIRSTVCVVGQHRHLLDQCLSLFNIAPDYDLDLMQEGQSLPQLTANAIRPLSQVLEHDKSDLVLVQGDTTSAMLASLMSFYEKIPVGHIEAGLRTQNRYSPFPEEINRRLISVLATLHFAPTERAAKALIAEGFSREHIFVTGNTVVDAIFMVLGRKHHPDLGLNIGNKKVILVTAHRRENLGKPLEDICLAVKEIAERNPDVLVVYPVHPNPRVRGPVFSLLSSQDRVNLIDPLDYDRCVHLLNLSYLVLTDSGGIQEEAPILGKPVLVLRNETERPEGVEAGTAKVVGTNKDSIVHHTERLLNDRQEYEKMARAVSPYGDGKAAERILRIILEYFKPK